MLSKVVSRGGKDWDDILGPLVFAYHTALHSSTGKTLFSLVYSHDVCVPASLNFYQSADKMPVMETEYAWELFSDLKYVTKLAQENIKKAQTKQKFSYDKSAKEPTIKVNYLVMLRWSHALSYTEYIRVWGFSHFTFRPLTCSDECLLFTFLLLTEW